MLGVLTFRMSLVLTFRLVASQIKALTLKGALGYQMSFAKEKGIGTSKLEKAERKDL